MRWFLLAALLAGCGFDGGNDQPLTEKECRARGWIVRMQDGNLFCDEPPDLAFAAEKRAHAAPGDAGTSD